MKRYILLLSILPLLASCLEDKGNYDYTEPDVITITNVPDLIEVLSYAENITVAPKFTSESEGEIVAGNSNFKIKFWLGRNGNGTINGQTWVDLNPSGEFAIDILAEYGEGNYFLRITVTDTRTNVTTEKLVDIKVGSTTYEGWLVLCNEGEQQRARLDMISLISSTDTRVIHDIAVGLPELHRATGLGFVPAQYNAEEISIFTEEGSYALNEGSLESGEDMEYNSRYFLVHPGDGTETMIHLGLLGNNGYAYDYCGKRFVFSDAGNVYRRATNNGFYEFALNAPRVGDKPEYRVAPYVGCSWARPHNSTMALFYDIDNQRFMGWDDSRSMVLETVPDPTENKRFSFDTDRDMVYMEGTRRSNGLVYAILEDAAGRSLYGINMAGNGFAQELYVENLTAPDFEQAEHFAFHSQWPFMFYAAGNKVYLYDIGTGNTKEVIRLGANEEVTLIKFNLFRIIDPALLNKTDEAFLDQQFQLVVATYDNSAADVNGGRVAFYDVDGSGVSISKKLEYDGFARVKDIVYRERK